MLEQATKTKHFDENSPMITPADSEKGTRNGSIELVGLRDSAVPRRQWFSSKFNHLYALLFIIALIMLTVLVVCIIMISRLNEAQKQTETALGQVPKYIGQAMESMQNEQASMMQQLRRMPQRLNLNMNEVPIPVPVDVHFPDVRRKPDNLYAWHDKTCKNLGKCAKPGFDPPPLVVLSIDGFARKYLDKNIVQSLSKLAECGVTAERVLPSYPSRTFPNHYTMVTGLYPESHGIVDNNIFDPTISPNIESMKKTKYSEFYQGTPIWSAYKKQTGKKTACLFWPGCGYNISGLAPDISPPYDQNLPFKNRIEIILEWLRLPTGERPGLITAYLDQPDTAGHYQTEDTDVDAALSELDGALDHFLNSLHEEGLLECINLAVISDHGMQVLNKTVYMEDHYNMTDLVGLGGVVGRIYRNGSALTDAELLEPLKCEKGEEFNVFTPLSMSTRKHYSRTAKIGDLIIEGKAGTNVAVDRRYDWRLTANHGYDYILDTMHTVFFARGPSIKKNTVVPRFQNIEYMNLWTDLLHMNYVPNNGTIGLMDPLFNLPPIRSTPNEKRIRECQTAGTLKNKFVACGNCSRKIKPNKMPRCTNSLDVSFSTEKNVCAQSYCNRTLLWNEDRKTASALVEILQQNEKYYFGCEMSNAKYANSVDQCDIKRDENVLYTERYLSANNRTVLGRIAGARISLPKKFVEVVLEPLNELTMNYQSKFGNLQVITGLANDANVDGVADTESTSPTHLYRIVLKCGEAWSPEGVCADPSSLEVLSFIFSLSETNVNCLSIEHLFLEYSARLKDVEMISGFNWIPENIPKHISNQLRTYINLSLW